MLSQFQMPQGQAPQLDLPDELFKDQAEQRVRVGLVVNEIIVKHELKADPALVDAQLQTIAEPYDEPDQVINGTVVILSKCRISRWVYLKIRWWTSY